jgi:hypothetical protein
MRSASTIRSQITTTWSNLEVPLTQTLVSVQYEASIAAYEEFAGKPFDEVLFNEESIENSLSRLTWMDGDARVYYLASYLLHVIDHWIDNERTYDFSMDYRVEELGDSLIRPDYFFSHLTKEIPNPLKQTLIDTINYFRDKMGDDPIRWSIIAMKLTSRFFGTT